MLENVQNDQNPKFKFQQKSIFQYQKQTKRRHEGVHLKEHFISHIKCEFWDYWCFTADIRPAKAIFEQIVQNQSFEVDIF